MSSVRTSIEEVIEKRGFIATHPIGASMRPFIKAGDTVILKKFDGNLSEGDCVLFFKSDGKAVLHRVVFVGEEEILTRGDFEKSCDEPIKRSQIVGVLTEYVTNKKTISVGDERYVKKYRRWNGRGRKVRLFFYRGVVRTGSFVKRCLRRVFRKTAENKKQS